MGWRHHTGMAHVRHEERTGATTTLRPLLVCLDCPMRPLEPSFCSPPRQRPQQGSPSAPQCPTGRGRARRARVVRAEAARVSSRRAAQGIGQVLPHASAMSPTPYHRRRHIYRRVRYLRQTSSNQAGYLVADKARISCGQRRYWDSGPIPSRSRMLHKSKETLDKTTFRPRLTVRCRGAGQPAYRDTARRSLCTSTPPSGCQEL